MDATTNNIPLACLPFVAPAEAEEIMGGRGEEKIPVGLWRQNSTVGGRTQSSRNAPGRCTVGVGYSLSRRNVSAGSTFKQHLGG